ncbi:MAG: single-stranded DNA-binding protein [Planctomycetota bacterium]
MADLNKVFLIGRLTHDPELRYTPNGTPVADLKLATSRKYATREGETREETLYIVVTVWNRQAENCCQYLRKGRAVHVEGYLKEETWETREGEKRSKIKVEAERVQFLEKKDDSISSPVHASSDDGGYSASPQSSSASSSASRRPSVPAATERPSPPRRPSPSFDSGPPDGGDDEDIPF